MNETDAEAPSPSHPIYLPQAQRQQKGGDPLSPPLPPPPPPPLTCSWRRGSNKAASSRKRLSSLSSCNPREADSWWAASMQLLQALT